MTSVTGTAEDAPPRIKFTVPSFGPDPGNHDHVASGVSRRIQNRLRPSVYSRKHVRVQAAPGTAHQPVSASSSVYLGSFTPRRSRASFGDSPGSPTPNGSVAPSPRASMSYLQLDRLLQDLNVDLETYGVEELRDGFFDGAFHRPARKTNDNLMQSVEETLPASFYKADPLSVQNFLPKQWHEIKGVVRRVITTRAGVKLTKSFLAFFIAYVICLVDVTANWLGRYNYIIALSALINHPGRTVGAQIDGTLSTIIGTASGLGWGAFALWLSDSTSTAAAGYGGILAAFLLLFMAIIAALRSVSTYQPPFSATPSLTLLKYFIRLYQLVLCAGMAISYTCLADTSEQIRWKKLFDYAIPWLLGQAISLLICCVVFPDAGARPLAVSLHAAFDVMKQSLVLPRPDDITTRRKLAFTFVNLSQAYRDLVLDISITRFQPADVMSLRNLMQGVIRSLLSLKTTTDLFDDFGAVGRVENIETGGEAVINIDGPQRLTPLQRTSTGQQAIKLIASRLADPTKNLLASMKTALVRSDAVLLSMSGYRRYLGPPESVSSDILSALTSIRNAMIAFDEQDDCLLESPKLPSTYSDYPEVVDLFLFVNPVRQAATNIEALVVKVMEMQGRHSGWRLQFPSYPFSKSLQRTNNQVRHDRGGVTAGFFFRSQQQLSKAMQEMQTSKFKPRSRDYPEEPVGVPLKSSQSTSTYEEGEDVAMDRDQPMSGSARRRYRAWLALKRLQGFEARFALKVALVTSLLSVPAWLSSSRGWWNLHESWWAVVMVWVMMHPR